MNSKLLDFQEISLNDIAKENNGEVEVVIPEVPDLNLKPVALKPPLEVYEGPRGERFAFTSGNGKPSIPMLSFDLLILQDNSESPRLGDLLAE